MRNKVRIALRTISIVMLVIEIIYVIAAFFSMGSTITLPVKSETVHIILKVWLVVLMCLFALSFLVRKDNQSRQGLLTSGRVFIALAMLFLFITFVMYLTVEWLYIQTAMLVAGVYFLVIAGIELIHFCRLFFRGLPEDSD